jgi:hypothetical protein
MKFWKIPIIFGILSVACKDVLGVESWSLQHWALLGFLALFYTLGHIQAGIVRTK